MIFTPSRPGHQRLEELRSLEKWIYTIRQNHMDMDMDMGKTNTKSHVWIFLVGLLIVFWFLILCYGLEMA